MRGFAYPVGNQTQKGRCQVAGLPTVPAGAPSTDPQLLFALLLVRAVRQDVQALLPQLQASGSITLDRTRVNRWTSALREAVQLVQSIPVILIFPPPPFAVFANAAVTQIEQALATIAALPSAAPLTFPPLFDRVILDLPTAQSLLGDLTQAEALLLRALQSA